MLEKDFFKHFGKDGKERDRSIITNQLFVIFLWIGVTLAFFQFDGKIPVRII